MLRGILFALGMALMSSVARGQDSAPERLAVVIGNQDYEKVVDLDNARNDAARMAEMLREMGFTVYDGYDVDRMGFEELLRRAVLNVREGSEIVFFYAGHGIQIGRRNYLLPTDVAFESVYSLPVESVTLDRVVELLSSKGHVHVAIIDACRDNPFPNAKLAGTLDASLFETKSGFDVFQTPLNSLVAFSTAPGMVAFDGQGENSPYTEAILSAVRATPEDDAQVIFSRVRQAVFDATEGKQVPWESSTLVTPFRFRTQGDGTRGLMLVQADQVLSGTGTAPRQTSSAAELPESVRLELGYDRRMDLGPALAEALGISEAFDVRVEVEPKAGTVNGTVGLFYEPALEEQRAVGAPDRLEDSFRLAIEIAGQSQSVDVALEMEVNACDLAAGDALDMQGVGYFRLPNEIEIGPALEACRAAVGENPGIARFRYQLGRAEQAAARFDAAFASYSAAMEAGHIRAKHGAARLLSSKRIDRATVGFPFDQARANALFEEAIAAGDPFAVHSRGLTLLREGETAEERERGFDLLDRAAELGHTYSMNELGIYFLTKSSDHYIPERGMRYLEASVAREDIYGFHNMGFVALYGLEGGEPDFARALEWFAKAAEGGHPKSPAAIARMMLRNQVPGDAAEALEWFDKGLARGDGFGGANGAALIAAGMVPGKPAHEGLIRAAKALHLQEEAAQDAAAEVLAKAEPRDLAKAVQALLNELGEDLAVDGAIGPATRGVLAARAAEHGIPDAANDPHAQLETAARIYWAERPTRPDLF